MWFDFSFCLDSKLTFCLFLIYLRNIWFFLSLGGKERGKFAYFCLYLTHRTAISFRKNAWSSDSTETLFFNAWTQNSPNFSRAIESERVIKREFAAEVWSSDNNIDTKPQRKAIFIWCLFSCLHFFSFASESYANFEILKLFSFKLSVSYTNAFICLIWRSNNLFENEQKKMCICHHTCLKFKRFDAGFILDLFYAFISVFFNPVLTFIVLFSFMLGFCDSFSVYVWFSVCMCMCAIHKVQLARLAWSPNSSAAFFGLTQKNSSVKKKINCFVTLIWYWPKSILMIKSNISRCKM